MATIITATKQSLLDELQARVEDKILEPSNAALLSKLITNAESDDEALSIAALGTTYKLTGFHFDKRLEKPRKTDTIRYFKKNEALSFGEAKDGEPIHKLIIGDNYDALQNLLIQYINLVDVIYIDPPYGKNSMGEFAETNYENAISRDNLLSMLYFRLQLAKLLLSDDGVIFCSIDDKNQAYVKGLFDEVFGESSFVASLVIESSVIAGPRRVPAMNGSIVKTAEFCLVYSRNGDSKIIKNLKFDYIDGFDSHYSNWMDKNEKKIISLRDLIISTPSISERFKAHDLQVNYENLGKIINIDKTIRDWLYSDEISESLYRKGDKENINTDTHPIPSMFKIDNKWYIKTQEGIYNIFRYKDRIGDCDDYFCNFGERQVRGNLWKGFSSDGGNLDKEGFVSFKNGKKPIRLVKQLIHSVNSNPNAIILDFFAGSGTTGHAVLDLNSIFNWKCTFILCQANEITTEAPNGIAFDITCKRLKRIMTGTCYKEGVFKKPNLFNPYGGKLDVYEIAEVSNANATPGKTPFDVIDETLYGKEKFTTVREKIEWVCSNFAHTQKTTNHEE